MKLLVFAHTPPPHHGQSYMVQVMLDGFGGDWRNSPSGPRPNAEADKYDIQCYHINARLSQKLEEIGDFRVGKTVEIQIGRKIRERRIEIHRRLIG